MEKIEDFLLISNVWFIFDVRYSERIDKMTSASYKWTYFFVHIAAREISHYQTYWCFYSDKLRKVARIAMPWQQQRQKKTKNTLHGLESNNKKVHQFECRNERIEVSHGNGQRAAGTFCRHLFSQTSTCAMVRTPRNGKREHTRCSIIIFMHNLTSIPASAKLFFEHCLRMVTFFFI